MDILIAGGRAEEAARDFANDVRNMARSVLPLADAIKHGEATQSERENHAMLIAQIQSMSDLTCYCETTRRFYAVRDYITKRREVLSARRLYFGEKLLMKFIRQTFH